MTSMIRIVPFVCTILHLIGSASAFRTRTDLSKSKADLSATPGIHGDFYVHNECPFSINGMAKNGFFSPVLHVQNQVATGDVWHPPNKLKTDFTVCVGLEFIKSTQAKWQLVKYIGTEAVVWSLTGAIAAGASVLAGSVVGSVALGWSASVLVGAGIICPVCAVGGVTASALTIYGFVNGIEMIADQVIDAISEASIDFLLSRKIMIKDKKGDVSLPYYTFEGLMFADEPLAQAAASQTIFHWARHLQETDRDIHWSKKLARTLSREEAPTCQDEKDCAARYASRVYLPEEVAMAWVKMLNSKFRTSLWPALHGDRHLYIRGGLSLPEYNTALGGWLVAAYTPLFISEEATPETYKESEFAACTQIEPGMIKDLMSRCKEACSASRLGKKICDARCEEKLTTKSSGFGVCRGTYTSTRQNMLGSWVCCAAGPQTSADTEERLAFPKFCLLNSDCHPPEEGNSKHDGKWACAETEIPKTNNAWENAKTCWQAPLVADAGNDMRDLLGKFPNWTVKDEVPLY